MASSVHAGEAVSDRIRASKESLVHVVRSVVSSICLAALVGVGLFHTVSCAPRGSAPTAASSSAGSGRVPLKVERLQPDVPVTFGIPMPKGALDNPDHVRILDAQGKELPSQITEVSTWEPADPSVKWIWVFFFTTSSADYVLEYGPNVHRAPITGTTLTLLNNQRPGGGIDVTTGPLKFAIKKGEGAGFIDQVWLDTEGKGFSDANLVATGAGGRGSFLDLVNDAGPDDSKAFVFRTTMERGTGPLHAIIRVDGEYRYAKANHAPAPFTTRIHAYAGRSYLTVDHTFVYTGDPDKHRKHPGEHEHIATLDGQIVPEDPTDMGWMQPNDRLAAAGLALELKLAPGVKARSALGAGRWHDAKDAAPVEAPVVTRAALVQTGPKPNRIPPVPESTATTRLAEGFQATFTADGAAVASGERAPGWMVVSDGAREMAIAMPRFLEEYPKEIRYDAGRATAYFWSPAVEPMSFARFTSALDREEETVAIENNAQGIAKTSTVVFDFRPAGKTAPAASEALLASVRTPPVAHADPAWYGQSGVFGFFAAKSDRYPEFQRAMDYKFEWMLFNQQWGPWYGMWDYGDWKLYFDGEKWTNWGNNEPSQDFICWLQFMRTGDARIFDAARANSRHTMDIDNIHWPADPLFIGDTNSSLDYWQFSKRPKGSPYLGIGSRHANQHWVRTLSAHVWVQGWMADYFLTADHRALDVAKQTADMHVKRIWGEHGLTGRRLYLALWNLMEVWDGTKDERYRKEIDDLVSRVLRWAETTQGGSLVVDRYGYADVYVSQSLAKYVQLTNDRRVAAALARHARRVRDVPPLNHEQESYLSSVYTLILGYELTQEPSLLAEIQRRLAPLKTDALAKPFDAHATQADLYDALEKVSHLPKSHSARRPGRAIWSATNGLRVYGWTHAYTLPYALDLFERLDAKQPLRSPLSDSSSSSTPAARAH